MSDDGASPPGSRGHPRGEPLLVGQARRSARRAARRGIAIVVVAAAAAAGAVISSLHRDVHPGGTTAPGVGVLPGGIPAEPGSAPPLIKLLTDRLVLSATKVHAGATIKATLILTNYGTSSVEVRHRCSPFYAVVLTNAAIPPDVVSVEIVCATAWLTVPPGELRLPPVTITTTYTACANGGGQVAPHLGRGLGPTPRCRNGQTPPLPAGRYKAVLVDLSSALPSPPPVSVTLT